jgi:hypothetical protein
LSLSQESWAEAQITGTGSPHGVFSYALEPVLWSAELDCQFHGETQAKRGIGYYRLRAKQDGRRIYLSTTKAGVGLFEILQRLAISRRKAEELRGPIVERWQEESLRVKQGP